MYLFIFGSFGFLLLHGVFFFLIVEREGYSLDVACRLLIAVAFLASDHGL